MEACENDQFLALATSWPGVIGMTVLCAATCFIIWCFVR